MENSLTINCPKCQAKNPLVNDSRSVKFCRSCGAEIIAQVVPLPSRPNSYELRISEGTTRPLPKQAFPAAKPTTVMASSSPRNQISKPAKAPRDRKSLLRCVVLLLLWVSIGIFLIWYPGQSHQTATAKTEVAAATPTPVNSPAEKPPEVERTDRSKLHDKDGNVVGEADILLLSKSLVWRPGKPRIVESVGDIVEKGKNSFSPQLQKNINAAPEVVVIGTADERLGRASQEALAAARTRNLHGVVSDVKGDETKVFGVNLGQWINRKQQVAYDDQRRIILIKILWRNKDVDLRTALPDALAQQQNAEPVYKHILNDYSRSQIFDVW